MNTLNILSAARIEPPLCGSIVATILAADIKVISIFDLSENVEYGFADARVRGVYERLRGDFGFNLRLSSDNTGLSIGEYDFAKAFSHESGSICAIDTPDGNPFTWILITPSEDDRIVSIDDDYRIVSK